MSALSLNSVNHPRVCPLPAPPPINIIPSQTNLLIFRSRKVVRPFSIAPILRNIIADSNSMANADCAVNGGPNEAVTPKYAEIIVIRHGETEWNSIHRIQGHLDVDLNDVGRKQALAVADRLSKEPKISAVYSSDLKRAFETAETIAKGCGVLEVTKEPDLRERHLGDLQGVVFNEISRVNPLAYKAFVSKQDDEEIPGGGESFNQLYDRCTSALQRIARKHKGERVVVVSHGGTIRALHRKACPHNRPSKVLNTCVSVFHVSADEDKWTIKSWGDVSHLDQTGFLDSGFGGDRNSG